MISWSTVITSFAFYSPTLYTFFLVPSKNILFLEYLWLTAQKKDKKLKVNNLQKEILMTVTLPVKTI